MPDLLKILLIDDNPDDRVLIVRELKKMFIIDVEEIIDYSQFEKSLGRLDFDIVITDYQLRWTTGIEVLIRIKTLNPLLPVIMFTGTGSEEIAVMAMKVGLDDYILKTPQHYVRLAMAVNSAILRMKDELLRKHAEQALKTSEENYRTLVENIELGFLKIDKDFNIIMVNEAFCRMFGMKQADCRGKKCYEFYNKSLLQCFCRQKPELQTGIKCTESLTQGYRSDHSSFELHLRTFPVYDEKGDITGYIEIAEDITDRIRSERIQEFTYNLANIQVETENLRELVKGIRHELSRIISLTNFTLILQNGFSGQYKVFFSDNNETVSQDVSLDRSLTGYALAAGKGLLLNHEEISSLMDKAVIVDADQELRQWMGIPLRSQKQNLGIMILKNAGNQENFTEADLDMVMYVSNQISNAIDNKLKADKLADNELKFRSIIEQSSDGISIIDDSGTITEWNEALSRITSLKKSEAAGRKVWELPPALTNLNRSGEVLVHYVKDRFDYIKQHFLTHDTLMVEHTISDMAGNAKVLHISLFPITINREQQTGIFVRDISRQKAAHAEIANARLKAEEANRLKSAFLSNISHEIRTPLNAIVGFAALMTEQGIADQEKKRYSDYIYENSRGLLEQFNNIIEVSKIESGFVTLTFSEVEVNEFVGRLGALMEERIRTDTIEFRIARQYPDKQIVLKTDVVKLQQALIQLLQNAIKFTSHGVIELGYTISGDGYAVFYVSDTGIGIDAGKVDVVFDLFRQADEQINRKFKGIGIGLNIVKKIVTLLNGEIRYEPGIPIGSVFSVSIPLTATKQTQAMENFSIDNIASTTDKWKDKTILIVEDVESNYQFLAATLRRSGAELVWARQGEDAIEMVKSGQKFDLVLMDVQLAGMDGYEVTSNIKMIRPDLPIVAQTAYAMVGEKEKSVHAGCDDYLAKPIRPSLLIQTISKYF